MLNHEKGHTVDFKAKLRRQMNESNVGMREVAEAAKARSHSTVARWLSGEATPRLSDLVALAPFLKVSVAYLADATVAEPGAGGGATSDVERAIVEKGRLLGFEQAARILDRLTTIGAADDVVVLLAVVARLGFDTAMDRLLSNPISPEELPRAVEGGAHPGPTNQGGEANHKATIPLPVPRKK